MENDPRLKNRYYAWLLISNFESHPDEVTKKFGIEPTKIKIKGEYRIVGKKTPHKILNKKNQWILDSDLSNNLPIEKHIEYLLKKIEPNKENLIKLTEKYSAELICAVYYYEANPGIALETRILKEISTLNIRLYFDIYCLADNNE